MELMIDLHGEREGEREGGREGETWMISPWQMR